MNEGSRTKENLRREVMSSVQTEAKAFGLVNELLVNDNIAARNVTCLSTPRTINFTWAVALPRPCAPKAESKSTRKPSRTPRQGSVRSSGPRRVSSLPGAMHAASPLALRHQVAQGRRFAHVQAVAEPAGLATRMPKSSASLWSGRHTSMTLIWRSQNSAARLFISNQGRFSRKS
jgi:hypothetical protein